MIDYKKVAEECARILSDPDYKPEEVEFIEWVKPVLSVPIQEANDNSSSR